MNTPSTFVQFARLQRQLAAVEEQLKAAQDKRYGEAFYSKFVTSSSISVLPYLLTFVTIALYRSHVAVDLTECSEQWFGRDGVTEGGYDLAEVGRIAMRGFFYLLSLPSGDMGSVSIPVWCLMCNKVHLPLVPSSSPFAVSFSSSSSLLSLSLSLTSLSLSPGLQ